MASLPFAARRPPDRRAASLRNFESATAEVMANAQPLVRRLTLYVLAAMIALAIYLICVVRLDRIVVAPGRLVPVQGTLIVQPLDKGILHNIRVRVGQTVKKGQVLATLDPTFTAADLRSLEDKVASLSAEAERLEAEKAGGGFTLADGGKYAQLQLQIFRQRQDEFASKVTEFDAGIRKDEAQIAGAHREIADDTERLTYARQIESMRQLLVQHGYGSRLALVTAQDQRAYIEGALDEAASTLEATEHDRDSLKAKRQAFMQDWRGGTLTELVEARNKLEAAQQDLAKARRLQDLGDLAAPEDGVIVKIAEEASPGAVVTPAQPLFTLVPLAAPLEAEVDVEARDVGFIHVGDPVKIKFSAYRFLEHGTGDGIVKTISQDSFTEDRDHREKPPFFRSIVSITAVHLHDVPPNFRLIPGMTLDADIVAGRRTIAWYLVGGALRSGAEAMREP